MEGSALNVVFHLLLLSHDPFFNRFILFYGSSAGTEQVESSYDKIKRYTIPRQEKRMEIYLNAGFLLATFIPRSTYFYRLLLFYNPLCTTDPVESSTYTYL